MDPVFLSRLQFALTTAFHYIFPPMSIGLGLILVIMEGMYIRTNNVLYHNMTKFWVRIFGLIFAVGVVSGIVLEFEFGTNWSRYSRYVGDVFGSALAAEGVFAFFLESGFLAILLFGWDKVSKGMHFFATIMVAFGSHFSALWIIIANSWMQTPAGYKIVEEGGRTRAEITDFWALVFNPSSMDRLFHVLVAAWQAGAWLVISVSAYYLLKKRHESFARTSIRIALPVAVIAALLQLFSGSKSAEIVAEYQPAKLAALEGHYAENEPADMYILGWVNEKDEHTFGIKIPKMVSYLLHRDSNAPVKGLKAFPPGERPPVNITFQAYHIMISIGMFLILISIVGLYFSWKGTLYKIRWLLWVMVFTVLGPQIANQVGWIAAEVGRQPWIVYGLMKTSEGVSPTVSGGQVMFSIIGFGIVYALLFAVFIYLLDHKIKTGPDHEPEKDLGGKRA